MVDRHWLTDPPHACRASIDASSGSSQRSLSLRANESSFTVPFGVFTVVGRLRVEGQRVPRTAPSWPPLVQPFAQTGPAVEQPWLSLVQPTACRCYCGLHNKRVKTAGWLWPPSGRWWVNTRSLGCKVGQESKCQPHARSTALLIQKIGWLHVCSQIRLVGRARARARPRPPARQRRARTSLSLFSTATT